MKKIFFSVLFAAVAIVVTAQQPKNVVHDPNAVIRNVSGFTGISVSGGISLYLSQGSSDAVAVSTDNANDTEKVKTEVKDGILKIYVENGAWNGWTWKSKRVKAYVTAKTIEKIDVSGSSIINVTDKISSNNLKFDLSGNSIFKGDLSASSAKVDINGASSFKGSLIINSSLKLEVSGASTMSLSGSVTTADIDVSGASSFKAYEFSIDNCKAEASGASSLAISVKKELNAEASGASSIKYIGSPEIKKLETSGASSIKKREN